MTELKPMPEPDADYDEFDGDEVDEYEAELERCGMTQDGVCLYAGTEYCDFDCNIDWSEKP